MSVGASNETIQEDILKNPEQMPVLISGFQTFQPLSHKTKIMTGRELRFCWMKYKNPE